MHVSRDDGDSSGEEGEGREESGPTDQKEGDTDTMSRSHNQPSQPTTSSLSSVESEHSLGLLDNETPMNIPASSVPTMPLLQPTYISG